MQINIKSFKEMKLQEVEGISYLGIQNGKVAFKIRDRVYRYEPDSQHQDLDAWDSEIRNQIGQYNQTGKALNFVKKTSSNYSLEDTTTTANMDLPLVNTTCDDEDENRDKRKYSQDGGIIR